MFLKLQLHHPGSVLKLRGHCTKAMYEDNISNSASMTGGGADAEKSVSIRGMVTLCHCDCVRMMCFHMHRDIECMFHTVRYKL